MPLRIPLNPLNSMVHTERGSAVCKQDVVYTQEELDEEEAGFRVLWFRDVLGV